MSGTWVNGPRFLGGIMVLTFLCARPEPAAPQSMPGSFNPPVNVSETVGVASDQAAIAIDGATIYVAWRQETPGGGQELRLRRSTTLGATFSDGPSGRRVTAVDAAETIYSLRIAARGTAVYVLFTAGVSEDAARARLAISADGGTSFAPPVTLADGPGVGGNASADLAIDGAGTVHVAMEDRSGSNEILHLLSTDGGATFRAPQQISNSSEPSRQPRIAASGPSVAIVWQEMVGASDEDPGAGEISFVLSGDGGITFGGVVNLSNSGGDSKWASVAIAAAIHVTWSEANDVVHRSSADGLVFAPAAVLGAAPAGSTIAAAMGASANTVHVSWTTTDSNGVTDGPFYRRSTDGGATYAVAQDLRFGSGGIPQGTPAIGQGTAARIVWAHTASGFAVDAEILFVGQGNCAVSWAAPVSGNWNDASKWSPAVVPGDWAAVCITVDGDYTVTVNGVQRANSLMIGDADNVQRPTLLIQAVGFGAGGSASLTVSNAATNSGIVTFRVNGSGGGGTLVANGVTVNSDRGLLRTDAANPGALHGFVTNYGTVEVGSRLSFQGNATFTNRGTFTIQPGADLLFANTYQFTQADGLLDVDGLFAMGASAFNFTGGDITGVVTLQGLAQLNIGAGNTRPATFMFRLGGNIPNGTTRISGDIAPAQTIKILSCCGLGGSISVTAANGFTNAGTIVLDSEAAGTTQSATLVITNGTLINTGTILVGDTSPGALKAINGSVENRGTVDFRDGLSFQRVGGVFTNLGTVRVGPNAAVVFGSAYVFNQNADMLNVQGSFEMSAEFSTAGDTFNFNGGIVQGTVVIQGHSRLNIGPASEGAATFHFERNVSFGVSSGGHLSGNIAAAQTVRVRATPGGTAQANVAQGFTNFGTLSLEATAANAGGASIVLAAGTLVNRGTLAVNEILAGAKALRGHVENHATMTVMSPLSLQLPNGTFNNFADLVVGPAGKITLAPAAVVTQHQGRMVLDGPIELTQEFSTAQDVFHFNGGHISGAAGVHVAGVGHVNIGAGAADGEALFVYRGQGATGGGTFSGNIGSSMTLRLHGSAATSANGFTNAGTIVITTEAGDATPTLGVTAGTLVNTGTIAVELTSTVAPINAVVENRGQVTIRDTISLSRANAAHVNEGTIEIEPGQTLTLAGNGTLRQRGAGRIAGGGNLTIAGGSTFFGVGDVVAHVTNNGRVEPGGSPGILDIAGNYTQTGRLEIEIQGAAPGSGHDQLNIDGAATLGGGLDVIVAPGFCVEQTYQILTYGSVGAADFAQKTGLGGLSGGRSLQTVKGENEYLLNVVGAPCNTPPTAANDSYTVDEDGVLSVAAPGVLGNDSDVDGNALSAALVDGPSHGTLAFQPDGSFTYTPEANFNGADGFTYRVTDGQADSGVATVSITVTAVADPPSAVDDGVTVAEDSGATSIDVLANDSVGADGGTLVVTATGAPANGTVAILEGGSGIAYTPAADFNGTDSFTCTIGDGLGGTATSTVTVTVTPVNDAPVGTADVFTVDEDQVLAGTSVLANDTDVDGPSLTAALVTGPANGTLALNADGTFTYTPNADFSGADGFTYEASDGMASSGPVTVALTINAVNDAPTGTADAFTVDEDQVLAGTSVLANDTDADSPALSAALVTGPTNGTLALNADGTFTYTPNADFSGTDNFTYEASDGTASSGPVTVSLTINSVNDAPAAVADAYTTDEDQALAGTSVLANDTDVDGPALSAVLVTGPANGTLTLNADGTFTYTPNANFFGTDSFRYEASDGSASSAPVTVSLTVNAVNDTPVGTADAFTVDEDQVLAGTSVLANDTDADGPALTAKLVTAPAKGTLALNADGTFTYTPNTNFFGTDSFRYEASDGTATSGPVTVSLTINAVNDAPTLAPLEARAVVAGTTIQVPLHAADVDDDRLTFAADGLPGGAQFDTSSGVFTWTPTATDAGTHVVTFTVSDSGGLRASQRLTIVVTSGTPAFPFTGFFEPVSNPPTVNVSRAGSAIPIKFSLGGDQGLAIFAPGFPQSTRISCTTGAGENETQETVTAGNSTLAYNPALDQYTYVWKTDPAWAGTCRQLIVRLSDGSVHTANFRFR